MAVELIEPAFQLLVGVSKGFDGLFLVMTANSIRMRH